MTRILTIAITAATLWLATAAHQTAHAQSITAMDAFLRDLKHMHVQALQFCNNNRNIMSASDLSKATKENDVFELLCMRALKGRSIANTGWTFYHEGERIEGGTSDFLAMLKGFNIEGKLFYTVIGHRKIKQHIGQPNARVFYQPRATLYRYVDGEMQHVFEFIDPQTMNWNSPIPEKPDFSAASKQHSVAIDDVWNAVLLEEFGQTVSFISSTQ